MLPTDGIQAIVANQQVMELRDGLQTEDGTWNPHSFSAIVGELGAYSLIRHAYDKQYYVHPLVHSWSQDRLPKNLQEGFCALAMHILSTAIDQMPWLKYLLRIWHNSEKRSKIIQSRTSLCMCITKFRCGKTQRRSWQQLRTRGSAH